MPGADIRVSYVVTGRAQKKGGRQSRSAPARRRPDAFVVRIAVNPANTTDGGTDWLEPVTDEEYTGD